MTGWRDHFQTSQALWRRHRQPEWMDQPGLNEGEHQRALRGLARVNWLSRSAALFWPTLRAFATRSRPLRVLDVACGGGDVSVTLARLARRQNVPLSLSGCDKSETALRVARQRALSAEISIDFFEHDVLKEPLPARFDVVICSLFLHHLDETEAVAVLRSMSQAAEQGVLVNDLIRSRSGYWLAVIGTRLLSRSPIVHVDGPLSVAGAFTPDEVLRLSEQAGLSNVVISRHWPQRMLLTWRRP
jgi:2-polyprenyl-3-methyl-5-hydroxy-6-metoxy-1,4-benzoquinol methylase